MRPRSHTHTHPCLLVACRIPAEARQARSRKPKKPTTTMTRPSSLPAKVAPFKANRCQPENPGPRSRPRPSVGPANCVGRAWSGSWHLCAQGGGADAGRLGQRRRRSGARAMLARLHLIAYLHASPSPKQQRLLGNGGRAWGGMGDTRPSVPPRSCLAWPPRARVGACLPAWRRDRTGRRRTNQHIPSHYSPRS